jgi:hypothetical protein
LIFSRRQGEAFADKNLELPGKLLAQRLRPYTSMIENERRTLPNLSQFPVAFNTSILNR